MFERKEYTVARIDGDYAYLQLDDAPEMELKCVARALLPAEIAERAGADRCHAGRG